MKKLNFSFLVLSSFSALTIQASGTEFAQIHGNFNPAFSKYEFNPKSNGQNLYGQNLYGQNLYGQNPYGQDPYGRNQLPYRKQMSGDGFSVTGNIDPLLKKIKDNMSVLFKRKIQDEKIFYQNLLDDQSVKEKKLEEKLEIIRAQIGYAKANKRLLANEGIHNILTTRANVLPIVNELLNDARSSHIITNALNIQANQIRLAAVNAFVDGGTRVANAALAAGLACRNAGGGTPAQEAAVRNSMVNALKEAGAPESIIIAAQATALLAGGGDVNGDRAQAQAVRHAIENAVLAASPNNANNSEAVMSFLYHNKWLTSKLFLGRNTFVKYLVEEIVDPNEKAAVKKVIEEARKKLREAKNAGCQESDLLNPNKPIETEDLKKSETQAVAELDAFKIQPFSKEANDQIANLKNKLNDFEKNGLEDPEIEAPDNRELIGDVWNGQKTGLITGQFAEEILHKKNILDGALVNIERIKATLEQLQDAQENEKNPEEIQALNKKKEYLAALVQNCATDLSKAEADLNKAKKEKEDAEDGLEAALPANRIDAEKKSEEAKTALNKAQSAHAAAFEAKKQADIKLDEFNKKIAEPISFDDDIASLQEELDEAIVVAQNTEYQFETMKKRLYDLNNLVPKNLKNMNEVDFSVLLKKAAEDPTLIRDVLHTLPTSGKLEFLTTFENKEKGVGLNEDLRKELQNIKNEIAYLIVKELAEPGKAQALSSQEIVSYMEAYGKTVSFNRALARFSKEDPKTFVALMDHLKKRAASEYAANFGLKEIVNFGNAMFLDSKKDPNLIPKNGSVFSSAATSTQPSVAAPMPLKNLNPFFRGPLVS